MLACLDSSVIIGNRTEDHGCFADHTLRTPAAAGAGAGFLLGACSKQNVLYIRQNGRTLLHKQ